MAVSVKNKIEYKNEQKKEEGLSYDIYLHGAVAGSMLISNDPDGIITFSKKDWVNSNDIKVIAKQICEKYAKPVRVKSARKVFEFTPTRFKQETKKHTTMCHYERYYVCNNHFNVYMASYHLNENGDVDLRLKKRINQKDAESVVFHFLEQYNVINLTVSQILQEPIIINKSVHDNDYIKEIIFYMLADSTTNKQERENNPKIVSSKKEGSTPKHNKTKAKPNDDQPKRTPGITNPVNLPKINVYRGKKQSEEAVRASAQKLANEKGCRVRIIDYDDSVLGEEIKPDEKEIDLRMALLRQSLEEDYER